MATCAKCGAETAAAAKFCKACGTAAQASGHDEKKARVLGGETVSRKTPVVIAIAVVLLVAGIFAFRSSGSKAGGMMRMDASRSARPDSAYAPVQAAGGEIRIAEDSLQGGAASYYRYGDGEKTVKFFILRAADGTVRVAFDACTACYHAKLGYRQDGEAMICNNCGMGFRSTDVGKITGGCSPIPVEKRTDGKLIVLKVKDLEAGAKYF